MRCLSCNALLTDKEATRKSNVTHEYFDMCDNCLYELLDDIPESIPDDDDLWDDIDLEIEDADPTDF